MGAHPSKSPSGVMCFLTYTPRADVDAHAYEQWVREVDNPLFMSIPGIAWYESWKVHASKNGSSSFHRFRVAAPTGNFRPGWFSSQARTRVPFGCSCPLQPL